MLGCQCEHVSLEMWNLEDLIPKTLQLENKSCWIIVFRQLIVIQKEPNFFDSRINTFSHLVLKGGSDETNEKATIAAQLNLFLQMFPFVPFEPEYFSVSLLHIYLISIVWYTLWLLIPKSNFHYSFQEIDLISLQSFRWNCARMRCCKTNVFLAVDDVSVFFRLVVWKWSCVFFFSCFVSAVRDWL